jgi:DNA uptake protein ComE-like DNA-binding protein
LGSHSLSAKEVQMCKPQHRNKTKRKLQDSMPSPKITNPIKVGLNKNDLEDLLRNLRE